MKHRWLFFLERCARFELAFSAWKAVVLGLWTNTACLDIGAPGHDSNGRPGAYKAPALDQLSYRGVIVLPSLRLCPYARPSRRMWCARCTKPGSCAHPETTNTICCGRGVHRHTRSDAGWTGDRPRTTRDNCFLEELHIVQYACAPLQIFNEHHLVWWLTFRSPGQRRYAGEGVCGVENKTGPGSFRKPGLLGNRAWRFALTQNPPPACTGDQSGSLASSSCHPQNQLD